MAVNLTWAASPVVYLTCRRHAAVVRRHIRRKDQRLIIENEVSFLCLVPVANFPFGRSKPQWSAFLCLTCLSCQQSRNWSIKTASHHTNKGCQGKQASNLSLASQQRSHLPTHSSVCKPRTPEALRMRDRPCNHHDCRGGVRVGIAGIAGIAGIDEDVYKDPHPRVIAVDGTPSSLITTLAG